MEHLLHELTDGSNDVLALAAVASIKGRCRAPPRALPYRHALL